MVRILQELEFRNSTLGTDKLVFDFKQENLTWHQNLETLENL